MGPSPGFGAGVIHRLCAALACQLALSPLLPLPARREAAAHSLRLAIRDIMMVSVWSWYRRVRIFSGQTMFGMRLKEF
ncbi:hypothetical protein THARTR1_10189 [Trichoderma harzianum]|uniref:Secreted protein n=1 Tax=Trichoderma harzianum TaxID=5544 RepID=A0A2K0TU94_TRIHA|nr:hypothetical protein THARTR1_10189 [Trichoderma harzianum]